MDIEFRYVAFAGDVRILQVRTRSPGGAFGEWGYVPDADIPTVDAQDVHAVANRFNDTQCQPEALRQSAHLAILASDRTMQGSGPYLSLEPIRKELESVESVVIHCAAPFVRKEGAGCGRRNIVEFTLARVCAIRAI
jgi:hypothetical protein